MPPHGPAQFLPSGREYHAVEEAGALWDDKGRWRGPLLVDQALQHHLLQVGYVDAILGTLVRRLQAVGLYDRALVVVVADHGISFEPGGSPRAVTEGNVADIAGVPFFVKYPGQRHGAVDRRAAETIDVVPTIADVVGARIPWHVDGRSLRAAPVVRTVTVNGGYGPVSTTAAAVASGVLATARRNAALLAKATTRCTGSAPTKSWSAGSSAGRAAPPRSGTAFGSTTRLTSPTCGRDRYSSRH